MNTLENHKEDLDQIRLKIGEARAKNDVSRLESLRKRKMELEREIEESVAESSYREAKAKADAEARRRAEIAGKLENFIGQTVAFKTSFHSVSGALKALKTVSQELFAAVNGFMDTQNPLMLLGSIWASLEPDQKAAAEEALDAIDFRGEVPRDLDALVETFDKLTGFVSSVGFQMMRFEKSYVPQSSAEKEPVPTERTSHKNREWVPHVAVHQGPRKPPADPYPDRHRNKPQGKLQDEPATLPMG